MERLGEYLAGNPTVLLDGLDPQSFFSRLLFSSSLEGWETLTHESACKILSGYGPRQVCQYQFKVNDIVWICKQCQKDETCVLCNVCYQQSNHEGHDVYFYHSVAGGCCDCGDAAAWDAHGFCIHHGKRDVDPVQFLPLPLLQQSRLMFSLIVNFMEAFSTSYSLLSDTTQFDPSDDELYALYIYQDDLRTPKDFVSILYSPVVVSAIEGPPEQATVELMARQGYLRIKSAMPPLALTRALHLLRRAGFLVRAMSPQMERRHAAMLEAILWMRSTSLACDGMCALVCQMLDTQTLRRLLYRDMHLDKALAGAFHNLLLGLMSVQCFKMTAAVAYALSYREICNDYQRGLGLSGATMFSLSVQFLNREQFVSEIVYHHAFLRQAAQALSDMIRIAPGLTLGLVSSITSRRYSPILGDLKIVFAIPEISRLFMSTCLPSFLPVLQAVQFLHLQRRAFDVHVQFEDPDWAHAFNLTLGLSSLFDYLVSWFSDPSSCIVVQKSTASSTIPTKQTECVSLTCVLTAITSAIDSCHAWGQSTHFVAYLRHSGQILSEAAKSSSRDLLAPHHQHIVLSYFSLEFSHTHTRSFHIPLHRFLAHMLLDACKHPHLIPTMACVRSILTGDEQATAAMMFTALQPLLFGCEVHQGKWKRNGICVYDQLMNYSEPPFCRIYRDADMGLLQFTLAVLPASIFLIFLFNESSIVKIMLQDALEFVGTSLPVEPDFTAGMVMECLQLLIQLATELPAPPSLDVFERCRAQLRKRWVHKLAAEPCTYSQLHESLISIPENSKLQPGALDELLMAIAVKNQTSALSASTYSLKKDLWVEYDPCYRHTSDAAHQSAMDRKPKLVAAQPIVLAPAPTHEFFAEVRSKLLLDHILQQSIRNLLHSAAWKRLKHDEYERQQLLDVAFDCNDNVFSKVVQLLTLVVHEIKTLQAQHGERVLREGLVAEFFRDITHERAQTMDSIGGPLSRLDPSTFRTLYRLRDWCEEVGEGNMMHHLTWLLEELSALSSLCREMADQLQTPASSPEIASVPPADFEALKRMNKERAMLSMQAAASQFLASLGDISDESDESDEDEDEQQAERKDDNGVKGDAVDYAGERESLNDEASSKACGPEAEMDMTAKGTVAKTPRAANEDEELLCIICQTTLEVTAEDAELGDFVGCLGLLQNSTVGRVVHQGPFLSEASSWAPRPQRGERNSCNHRLGMCGHMMHSVCFSEYRDAQHSAHILNNMMILDSSLGYVTCPLCKKLCNVLVPMAGARDHPAEKSEERETTETEAVEWLTSLHGLARDCAAYPTTPRLEVQISYPLQTKAIQMFGAFLLSPEREEDIVAAVEMLVETISYTISMDLAEHIAAGYHLEVVQVVMAPFRSQVSEILNYAKYSPGFDDLKRLDVAIEALGQATRVRSLHAMCVLRLVQSLLPDRAAPRPEPPDEDSWLGAPWPPLLQLPLLDVVVLVTALVRVPGAVSSVDPLAPLPTGLANTAQLLNALPWLALAKLVQLCVHSEAAASSAAAGTSGLLSGRLSALLGTLVNSGVLVSSISAAAWQSILLEWVAFMRTVIHLSTRIPSSPIKVRYLTAIAQGDAAWAVLPLTDDDITSEVVERHMETLNLTFLLRGNPIEAVDWNKIGDTVSGWREDRERYLDIGRAATAASAPRCFDYRRCGRYAVYPCRRQQQLITLPNDYTRLHADVMSKCSYELPAVCLTCGAIVNANGNGHCYYHAESCGEGVGMFFLVQDCNIVLCKGPRSAYFPSIYVDAHGEIHRTYRGKPLRLDRARLEALRSLWASFGVAAEVIIKRSSANRVIINGFY